MQHNIIRLGNITMIEKNGFLSSDIEAWKIKHRSDNKQLFQLCEILNEFSHDTMLSLNVSNDDLTEILSACSFVRAMSNFQSIVILCELGLINEAKIILRCLVEAMFLMVAIAKDHDFSLKIVNQDLLEQQRTSKVLKKNILNGVHKLDKPTLEEVDKRISELKKQIKDNGVKLIYKSDIARAAGLSSFYDTIYHILSGTVHINPSDLEQYLDLTPERNVKEIKWGPDVDEIEDVLFSAIESMIFVLQSIAHVFKVEYGVKWDALHNEYKTLGGQVNG